MDKKVLAKLRSLELHVGTLYQFNRESLTYVTPKGYVRRGFDKSIIDEMREPIIERVVSYGGVLGRLYHEFPELRKNSDFYQFYIDAGKKLLEEVKNANSQRK